MDTVTIIGIIGATIILMAFLFNQFGRWANESRAYDVANVLGSGFLMYYAYLLESWPFLVLNAVWLIVSLRDVIKSYR
jgi:hypothetical protein